MTRRDKAPHLNPSPFQAPHSCSVNPTPNKGPAQQGPGGPEGAGPSALECPDWCLARASPAPLKALSLV